MLIYIVLFRIFNSVNEKYRRGHVLREMISIKSYCRKVILFGIILLTLIGTMAFAKDNKLDQWSENYLSTNETSTFIKDGGVYPNIDSTDEEGIEVKRGDKVQVVQPVVYDEKSGRIQIIIKENTTAYVRSIDYISYTERKSDSCLLSIYKKYMASIGEFAMGLTTKYMIFTVLISAVLIFIDPIIDGFVSRYITVKNNISLLKLMIPGFIYIFTCIVCNMFSQIQLYKILNEGFVLLPKEDTIMNWSLYLSFWFFAILSIFNIYVLFKSYNPVFALLKIIEAIILDCILSIVFFALGLLAIGVFIVISIFSFAGRLRYVEVKEW